MDNEDLSELASQTQLVYERNAVQFANERPKKLIEKPWLDRFRQLMPKQGKVLDLGCGAGEPIGAYFLELGYCVVGLDASTNMIRIAKERQPTGDWRVGDMRSFNLSERFHGIIGWNSFFHLTRDEQRTVLPNVAKHLRPNGALILTVGPDEGEAVGLVGDDPIYHASLSQREYVDVLRSNGLEIEYFDVEDPDCYDMTILLARKNAKNSP